MRPVHCAVRRALIFSRVRGHYWYLPAVLVGLVGVIDKLVEKLLSLIGGKP